VLFLAHNLKVEGVIEEGITSISVTIQLLGLGEGDGHHEELGLGGSKIEGLEILFISQLVKQCFDALDG